MSAQILADLLPSLRGLGLLAQDAHWRVLGPMFGELHTLFGDLYAFVSGTYADDTALGGPLRARFADRRRKTLRRA